MGRTRFTLRDASGRTGSGSGAGHRGGTAGRVGISLFFLIWCLIPTVMVVFMVREVVRDAGPWFWGPADCTIVDSGVAAVGTDGDDYAFTVRYTYAAGSLSAVEAPVRQGDVYARGYRGSADYSKAQRLLLHYAPGTRATCYVDPDDPTQAVLKREPPWLLLMLPLPLLFVAIGVGGLWFTWRREKPAGEPAPAKPISSGPSANALGRRGAWALAVFCGIFFGVGVLVLWAMGGGAVKVLAARSWTPVQATVVSSDVRRHNGDSTTYSVNILYAYEVGGRQYKSNRYKFMGGSSSGYEGKRQVVRQYPPGRKFTAYVNGDDPVEAVIERGFTADMLLLLIPLAFMSAGGVGGYFAIRHARRKAAPGATSPVPTRLPSAGRYVVPSRPARTAAGGRATLKPQQSPVLKLVVISAIALFWNGIVSVFVYQAARGFVTGRIEVCLTVFLVPFVLVGLALIVGAFHSLLALFNPRCELTLDREAVALGDVVEVKWSFTGRYDRLHRLVLRVEAREEATYRRGTSTYTDKNVFYLHELVDTSRAVDMHSGKARWTVPPDSMHSFSAPNNKIVWVLCLHGHIHGWPDVKDEYVLAVAPLPAGKATAAPVEDEPQDAREESWS